MHYSPKPGEWEGESKPLDSPRGHTVSAARNGARSISVFSAPCPPPVLGSHSSCCNLLQLSSRALVDLRSLVPHVSCGRKTTNAENSYFRFLPLLWNLGKSAQYSRALLAEFFLWCFPILYHLTSEMNVTKELHSLWRPFFTRLRIDRKRSTWCN